MGSLVVDWKDDFLTGMGYNTATGQLCSTRTVKVEADPQTASSTTSPTSRSKLVESDDSFADAMNLSASFSTSYYGIGMSASASFMLDMKINRKTSAVVKYVQWRDDDPTLVYTSKTPLNADAQRVLENDGPEAFYNKFGDCFIGGYYKGGQCFAGYRMEFSSVEEKIQAKASVEASYLATSGSANFESDLKSSNVKFDQALNWHSVGYPSGTLPVTQGTWKEAVDFLDKINTRLGDELQAVLARYDSLDSYSDSLAVYKGNHPGASFVVPRSAFPGLGSVKDFNEVYAQLSYVRSQLAHTVKLGLIYQNPGDIQRQGCLQKITDFQDNIYEKLKPTFELHDSTLPGSGTTDNPTARFRKLQKEGENLVKAGQIALNNFDGAVIELWNVPKEPWPPGRGDVRVSLDGSGRGAGLVLYSAGPKAGSVPGPSPVANNLASKFKVWEISGTQFALQALGVSGNEPIFVGLGTEENWSKPFQPWGVPMLQFVARHELADIFGDVPPGSYRSIHGWCFRRSDAGNGMVTVQTDWSKEHLPPVVVDASNAGIYESYVARVSPAAGDWTPSGNANTPYWMVGLMENSFKYSGPGHGAYPEAVKGWLKDVNAQWQIRIVDDSQDDPVHDSGHATRG